MVRPGEGAAHDLFEVEGTIRTDQARVVPRPHAAARGRWEWKHPGQALVSKRRARRVDVVGCRALGGVRERGKEELLASRRCHAPRARRGGRRALHPASRPPTARQEERPRQKLCTRVTARVRTKGSRRKKHLSAVGHCTESHAESTKAHICNLRPHSRQHHSVSDPALSRHPAPGAPSARGACDLGRVTLDIGFTLPHTVHEASECSLISRQGVRDARAAWRCA